MNQDKLTHLMSMAIYNALNDPDILRPLSKLSYDTKALREGEKLCNQFKELIEQQGDAQRLAKEATRNLQATRQHLQQKYLQHLSIARVIFKEQPQMIQELGLKGKRKQRIENWLMQCQRFYYHAAKYAETLAKYNITPTEIAEMQSLLSEIIGLHALQKQAQGRAQILTRQKQEMGALTEHWYRKFIKVARLALDAEPQQMEALGIVVKA
ncbi:hypothetical protein [Catalinimonas niigatensis]|uniref:hypothetical protein n=1 Tax=Catalinimonas niigatensis TaxID=1397264 RepID=UPI00266691C5|nr:hypothetical protein [Catalinimonas niigatensis]WPP51379.1 hypothetical protein PZB72_03135 [Catalinimonas niigatensis]